MLHPSDSDAHKKRKWRYVSIVRYLAVMDIRSRFESTYERQCGSGFDSLRDIILVDYCDAGKKFSRKSLGANARPKEALIHREKSLFWIIVNLLVKCV